MKGSKKRMKWPQGTTMSSRVMFYKERGKIIPDLLDLDFMVPLNTKISERGINYELKEAIGRLNPKQERVIFLRFWEKLPRREIGKTLGVSGERTRQIEERALRILRNYFIYNKPWRV